MTENTRTEEQKKQQIVESNGRKMVTGVDLVTGSRYKQ